MLHLLFLLIFFVPFHFISFIHFDIYNQFRNEMKKISIRILFVQSLKTEVNDRNGEKITTLIDGRCAILTDAFQLSARARLEFILRCVDLLRLLYRYFYIYSNIDRRLCALDFILLFRTEWFFISEFKMDDQIFTFVVCHMSLYILCVAYEHVYIELVSY